MALGSCGHGITHQLRPINMNGRSILSETSVLSKNITHFPRHSSITPNGATVLGSGMPPKQPGGWNFRKFRGHRTFSSETVTWLTQWGAGGGVREPARGRPLIKPRRAREPTIVATDVPGTTEGDDALIAVIVRRGESDRAMRPRPTRPSRRVSCFTGPRAPARPAERAGTSPRAGSHPLTPGPSPAGAVHGAWASRSPPRAPRLLAQRGGWTRATRKPRS